jgi:hypothetical protein
LREKPLLADFICFEEYHLLRVEAIGRTHFFPAPWYPVKGYSGLSHASRAIEGSGMFIPIRHDDSPARYRPVRPRVIPSRVIP